MIEPAAGPPSLSDAEPGISDLAPADPPSDPGLENAPSSAPEAGHASHLEQVVELQARILGELGRLGEDFSLKFKFDQAKERAIDTLSEEVQRHRQGLHFSILRPLFLDLISLHDDLVQLTGAAPSDDATARTFDSLAATVEEILARNGVFSFEVEGEMFDGKRQRAVRTVVTGATAAAGLVAQRLRRGFEYEGRVLRPEHVVTYRYLEEAPAEPDLKPDAVQPPPTE